MFPSKFYSRILPMCEDWKTCFAKVKVFTHFQDLKNYFIIFFPSYSNQRSLDFLMPATLEAPTAISNKLYCVHQHHVQPDSISKAKICNSDFFFALNAFFIHHFKPLYYRDHLLPIYESKWKHRD